MPKPQKTKVVRLTENNYHNLLFIKSRLETKTHELKSFSDVVDYLIEMWCKKYDRRKR
jgi:predicted CopG family antitoxin